ncbi:MAG: hypothetical protein M1541_19285, partial [Acidobacteria bacterium]|nr:hypothetical protein [Acidobacteriota bacterium]
MRNNGISSASPTVLPAAERREAERSEADRSAAAGKTVAAQPPTPPHPNPEVVATAKRRTFTAEYKQRMLAEADAASAQPGAIGALLRRIGANRWQHGAFRILPFKNTHANLVAQAQVNGAVGM